MKILIVTKDLNSRGGVATFFRLFQKYFRSQDITVEFLAVGSRPQDYERRERRHFAYFRDLWNDLLLFRRRLRTDSEIEIVQVNPSLIPVALFRDALFLILARRYQKKTVVFFHGWRDDGAVAIRRSCWKRTLFKRVFLQAQAVAVLARRFADVLTELGYPVAKLSVVTTGYDAGQVCERPIVARDTPLRVIYLGRISQAKGVDVLIEALKNFAATGASFKADIFGHAADPKFLESMRQKAADMPQIKFNGFVDGPEKFAALTKADVFVLPSIAEGCPTALIEAAGCGCFCLATPVGAVPELLTDAKVGAMFSIGDVAGLEAELRHCAGRLPELRQNTTYIKDYAERHWDMKIIAAAFYNLYNKLQLEK